MIIQHKIDPRLRYAHSIWSALTDAAMLLLAVGLGVYCIAHFNSGATVWHLFLMPPFTVCWIFVRLQRQIEYQTILSHRERLALTYIDAKQYLYSQFAPPALCALLPILIAGSGVFFATIYKIGDNLDSELFTIIIACFMKAFTHILLALAGAADLFVRNCRAGREGGFALNSYLLCALYVGVSIIVPWLDLVGIIFIAVQSNGGDGFIAIWMIISLCMLGAALFYLIYHLQKAVKVYFQFE